MTFERCYVTNSICAPSRAVILSGRHSFHNGQMTNGDVFDGSQVTFPKLLRKAGYSTALIGKWHLSRTRRDSIAMKSFTVRVPTTTRA